MKRQTWKFAPFVFAFLTLSSLGCGGHDEEASGPLGSDFDTLKLYFESGNVHRDDFVQGTIDAVQRRSRFTFQGDQTVAGITRHIEGSIQASDGSGGTDFSAPGPGDYFRFTEQDGGNRVWRADSGSIQYVADLTNAYATFGVHMVAESGGAQGSFDLSGMVLMNYRVTRGPAK